MGATSISELADQVALKERNHTQDNYERICTSLIHIHLPKLAHAGVLTHDLEQETVELREKATMLTPYLEFSAEADLR